MGRALIEWQWINNRRTWYSNVMEHGFSVFVGNTKEIENLYQFIAQDSYMKCSMQVDRSENGFSRLLISEGWLDRDISGMVDNLEYLLCRKGKYGDGDLCYSAMGSKEVTRDYFDREWEPLEDWALTFVKEIDMDGGFTIRLKDGTQKSGYEVTNIAMFDDIAEKGLTLAKLIELCSQDRSQKEKKEFATEFAKEIGSIDNVAEILLSYRSATKNIENKYLTSIEDMASLMFAKTVLREDTSRIYDFANMRMTESTKKVLTTVKNPLKGQLEYVSMVVEDVPSSEIAIRGIVQDNLSEFLFETKDGKAICELCLSNIETVVIPDTVPQTGEKILQIGEGCFKNGSFVKKIIIPSTVTVFGADCFAGAKKLVTIEYQGMEGEEDIVLQKKGKLIAMLTLKSEIQLDDAIESIGKNAFAGCPKLKSITLNSSVQMHNEALCSCKSLKKVILVEGNGEINIKALEKAGIEELILPDGRVAKASNKFLCDSVENMVEDSTKENMVRVENPADAGPKLYVKVKFADNRSYAYFCEFKVQPGDKVFVGGKKAGESGEIVEIIPSHPNARAAMYTLSVEKAFNVTYVEKV